MSNAVANVQLQFKIGATDSASDVIRKAQSSVQGLQSTAADTAKAAGSISDGLDPAKVQQTTQRMGAAFSGIAAAAGPAGAQIAEIGRNATALGSTANIIPGPIGLAAAAIVGLAMGAKFAYDWMQRTAAAADLLQSPAARKLGDDLNFSSDQTTKLSKALSTLRGSELVPSDALLKEVADNAVRLGQDPAENVAKFIAAWKDGPEAIQAVQVEIGQLSVRIQSVHEVARSLNLNPEELGLDKSVGSAERLAAHMRDVAKARADVAVNEKAVADAKAAVAAKSTIDDEFRALQDKVKAAKEALAVRKSELAVSEMFAQGDAKALRTAQAITELEKYRGDLDQATESKAGVARTKAEAHKIRLNALQTDRTLIERQIAMLEAAQSVLGDKDVKDKTTALKQLLLQLDVRAKGEKDAAKADARAASDAANAKQNAIATAQLAAVRSRVDRDGLQTEFERYELLRLEHEQAVKTASQQRDPKVRTAQLRAEDERYATAKLATERTLAKEVEDLHAQSLQLYTEVNQKSAEIAQTAAETGAQAEQVRAKSMSDRLRAQGREVDAAYAERAQAEADYAAAVIRIAAELKAVKDDQKRSAADVANAEVTAKNKTLIAAQAVSDKERALDMAKRQRTQESFDVAAAAIDSVSQRLLAIGQNGNISATAIGQSVGAMSKGLSALGKIADDDAKKMSKTVAAVGDTAASVAGAIIDAQTQRLLAQIDSEEQAALGTAKTEAEKAAIVEKYEKKKADAKDAAQRQNAGIQAVVQAAEAIASFASYDFVGGFGHLAAAAALGAVAGGAVGSSYVPGAATSGGSGGFNASAPAGGSSGSSGNGGSVTQINNFNGIFATQQQLGKVVNTSQNALAGTGIMRRKGA